MNHKQDSKKNTIKRRLLLAMVLMTGFQPIMCLDLSYYAARLGITRTPTRKELLMLGGGVLFTAAAMYFWKQRNKGGTTTGRATSAPSSPRLRKQSIDVQHLDSQVDSQGDLHKILDEQIQKVCNIINELETKIESSGDTLSIVNDDDREKIKQAQNILKAMDNNIQELDPLQARLYFLGIKGILWQKLSKYMVIQKVFRRWDKKKDLNANFTTSVTKLNTFLKAIIADQERLFLQKTSTEEEELLKYFIMLEFLNNLAVLEELKAEIAQESRDKKDVLQEIATLDDIFTHNDKFFKEIQRKSQQQTVMQELYAKLSRQVEQCLGVEKKQTVESRHRSTFQIQSAATSEQPTRQISRTQSTEQSAEGESVVRSSTAAVAEASSGESATSSVITIDSKTYSAGELLKLTSGYFPEFRKMLHTAVKNRRQEIELIIQHLNEIYAGTRWPFSIHGSEGVVLVKLRNAYYIDQLDVLYAQQNLFNTPNFHKWLFPLLIFDYEKNNKRIPHLLVNFIIEKEMNSWKASVHSQLSEQVVSWLDRLYSWDHYKLEYYANNNIALLIKILDIEYAVQRMPGIKNFHTAIMQSLEQQSSNPQLKQIKSLDALIKACLKRIPGMSDILKAERDQISKKEIQNKQDILITLDRLIELTSPSAS